MDKVIRQSELLIQWLDRKIDGIEVPSNRRSRLSAGCLEVALEHQRAIVLLVAHKLHGSAFSLSRVLFEAYVRGVWLRRCANELDLQRFEEDRFDRAFSELLVDIEKLEGFEARVLSDIKTRSWHVMNSFTHTGVRQVVRRQTETTIESAYDAEEIREIVDFSRVVGFLSAMEIALLAEKESMLEELLIKMRETWPEQSSAG